MSAFALTLQGIKLVNFIGIDNHELFIPINKFYRNKQYIVKEKFGNLYITPHKAHYRSIS